MAAAALLAGAASSGHAFTLEYDVRFGPLRLFAMRTTVELAPDAYRTATVLRTVGLAGVLFPWTSEAVTEGRRGPLRPHRHSSDGRFRGEHRRVEIEYAEDGGVRARVEPPPTGEEAVPPEVQRATVDPLTASLAAIEQDCRGRVPVFDGRRRYDLRLEDGGTARLDAASHRLYAGPTRRCLAVVEALGGSWRSGDDARRDTPTTLEFWVASPRPDLVPVPVYLELSGARGTLRIDLTAIEAGAGADG